MIEVTTFPDLKTIFINFGYKGIPENIPITSIVIRNKPASLNKISSLATSKSIIDNNELEETDSNIELQPTDSPSVQFTETGESIISIPDDAVPD